MGNASLEQVLKLGTTISLFRFIDEVEAWVNGGRLGFLLISQSSRVIVSLDDVWRGIQVIGSVHRDFGKFYGIPGLGDGCHIIKIPKRLQSSKFFFEHLEKDVGSQEM